MVLEAGRSRQDLNLGWEKMSKGEQKGELGSDSLEKLNKTPGGG